MIKAALILDNDSLTRWQRDALAAAAPQLDIRLVLSCRNTMTKKHLAKNFLYYVLNYLSLKNRLTGRSKYDADTPVVAFDSIYEGMWQRIPEGVTQQLLESGIKVVIKFGMSLLRIDESLSKLDILSFHHGDPTRFRGRPAGFYEVLQGEGSVGTIVQSISNKLDAGKVWAICHSKVHHHSYKKTALNFYENSRHLLLKALINYANDSPVELVPNGKVHKLPSNAVVLRFLALLAYRKLSRVLYGAFYEKKWNVATFDRVGIADFALIKAADARPAPIAPGYKFYADPFFSADGSLIRLEALNASNGLGEIVEVDRATLAVKKVLLKGAHYSYPFSFVEDGTEYLLPEVASHSSPRLFQQTADGLQETELKGLEDLRVLDGTVFRHDGIYYLFGGMDGSAADCLHIFYARSLADEFKHHPLNPVVIDPARARMAGRIMLEGGRILRFGQDNSYGYGDGVSVSEVTRLSPEHYEEKVIHAIRFKDASGPHTVDAAGAQLLVDYYVDEFSILAGYRRLVPLLLRRSY